MVHRVVRVGRVAVLAAAAVVAVALVSLVMQRTDSLGLQFVAAIAAGVAVLGLGWRWAWRPTGAQLDALVRASDAAVRLPEELRVERVAAPAEPAPPAMRPVETYRRPSEPPGPLVPIQGGDVTGRAAGQVAALIGLGLRSGLRQAALSMETAAELEPDRAGMRLLLSIGHSASTRAQELLAGFERRAGGLERTTAPEARRTAYTLREDVAASARALGFELGCEVALRFSSNFPGQVMADRLLFRLALAAVVLECAARGAEGGELLIEASHDDLADINVNVRISVSATNAPTIGDLPSYLSHSAESGLPTLLGLSQLLQAEGGHLHGSASGLQLGFLLPMVRHKRLTGSSLYGLGALSDRRVMVIDPRPIGRVTICEQLAAWRLSPTGVASVVEAFAVARDARVNGKACDLLVVSGFAAEQPAQVLEIVRDLAHFGCTRVVSLEGIESLCQPLLPELEAAPEFVLRRLARPPSPTDLVALLTELLAPPPEARLDTPRRGDGLTLLVAEDNVVNQALMKKMLERRGHGVRVVDNGAELVDRLWEAPGEYDAVLMDIQMPVMDGYEAAGVIRLREARSRRPRIPIIAVTAHAMGGERERCLEAGMDGYLAKPIDDDELSAMLSALAERARPAASAPAAVRSPDDTFDRQLVLELADGDMGFLKGLVDLFGESAPRLVAEVAAHLAAADSQSAHRKAHQLKGSIGNFGADRARAAAGEIEELARQGEVARAIEHVPALRREVEALVAALRGLIGELAG